MAVYQFVEWYPYSYFPKSVSCFTISVIQVLIAVPYELSLQGNYGNGEDGIPSEEKIPRVTSAFWRFKDGGVGSLTHTVALQGLR